MNPEVKVGDEVSAVLRHSGIVTSIDPGRGFMLSGRDEDRPAVAWISAAESWLVEIITPAPVPFLLNEPLTRAMGEPPLFSVIGSEKPGWEAWVAVRRPTPHTTTQWLDTAGATWTWSEILASVEPILIRLGNGAD